MFMNMLFSIHLPVCILFKQVNMLMCNVNTRFLDESHSLDLSPTSLSLVRHSRIYPRSFPGSYLCSLILLTPAHISSALNVCEKAGMQTFFPLDSPKMKFVYFLEQMECVKEHKTLVLKVFFVPYRKRERETHTFTDLCVYAANGNFHRIITGFCIHRCLVISIVAHSKSGNKLKKYSR